MKIALYTIGKTDSNTLLELINTYEKRLSHYVSYERVEIPDIKNAKNLSESQQKIAEGTLLLSKLEKSDFVILLDEKGKNYTSKQFSEMLNKRMYSGLKRLVFIIGGPYGFSNEMYDRGHSKCSLSSMTFSHQMVRLFFTEQVYRACTILKGEPYHHE